MAGFGPDATLKAGRPSAPPSERLTAARRLAAGGRRGSALLLSLLPRVQQSASGDDEQRRLALRLLPRTWRRAPGVDGRRRLAMLLVPLLLPLAGCAAGPPASAPRPPAPRAAVASVCDRAAELQVQALQAINAVRASARRCGAAAKPAAPSLAWSPQLARAAAAHGADMARHDYFDHAGRDGRNVGDRALAAGYEWRAVGENIALGQPGVAEVVQGWLGSPGHCENLMNPAFREAGLACVRNREGRPLWTLNLGTRR